MRIRSFLAATAVVGLAVGAVVVATTSTPVEAAPPGCRANSNGMVEFCDHLDPFVRGRGAIGLVGDSVLLGSSPGMSTPSLPTMLAGSGWGPIRQTTSLGMRTIFASPAQRDASAFHWMGRWKADGFDPRVIAVNVGGNHMGTCSWPNIAPCKAAIDQLLDEITAQFPRADLTIWWAKFVYRVYPSGAYGAGMLGWNAALDQAAAERPNLVVWDWPTALASANPPITTDLGGVHPVSGAEYVKRSTLIAEHLNLMMPANFVGPRVDPPALGSAAMAFTPLAAAAVYDTNAADVPALVGGDIRSIDLSGVAPGAGGVALTVTARNAAAGGFLRLFPCDGPQPATSNLNFQPGVVRTAQVLVALSASQQLCAFSNIEVDIDMSLQGTFGTGGVDTFAAIAPVRAIDTRLSARAADLEVPVPASDAVAASVVVVGQSAGGTITVYECGTPVPTAFTLSFQPDEVVAGAIFVPVSAANTICVRVDSGDSRLVDVIVDITGTFSADPSGLRFSPVTGTRLLDTRSAEGGWYGRQAQGQTVSVVGAPAGTEAISGTLTMVHPLSNSHLRAHRCGDALPPTSVVNAMLGLAAANNVTSGVATDRTLCIWASQNTNTLFDIMGYWVRAAG